MLFSAIYIVLYPSRQMKREKLHTVSIILGSVLALAIAFSQYLTSECIAAAQKTKTEQTDNTGEEKGAFISLPSFSIPVPVNVQSNLDAYFLFEIFFEENIDENHIEDDLLSYADRFFETMFQVIISPNAP